MPPTKKLQYCPQSENNDYKAAQSINLKIPTRPQATLFPSSLSKRSIPHNYIPSLIFL
jgi:hypothetical protein